MDYLRNQNFDIIQVEKHVIFKKIHDINNLKYIIYLVRKSIKISKESVK
jgi:hypothetical protein